MRRVQYLGFFYLSLSWGLAKDFGTHGHVFTILEDDLLEVIEKRLGALASSGKLKALQERLQAQGKKSLLVQPPVSVVMQATHERQWVYDPSFYSHEDLKDHRGHVFHKAGTRINPLDYKTLTQTLLFINGEDPHHIAWAQEISRHQRTLWILVKGSPFRLGAQQGHPVYFDQGGYLTRTFGIQQVPCSVRQQGKHLLLNEYKLEDSKEPHASR